MGASSSSVPEAKTPQTTGAAAPAPGGEKKLKACCACPETKKARDQCIVENGEENCGALIQAHKKCMREAGFDI